MISQETKQKISDNMPNRRRVNAEGVIYESVRKCALQCKISPTQVLWRIRNWDNWTYMERE